MTIPLIWFGISISRPVSGWFQNINYSTSIEEGNPLNRTIFIGLLIIGLIFLIRLKPDIKGIFGGNKYMLLFLIFCFLSISWADYPIVSLKRFIKEIGTIVMVLILCTCSKPFVNFSSIFRITAYAFLPLSIIMIKYFPEKGRSYHLYTDAMSPTGVTMNKNALGALCLMSGLFLFREYWISRKREGIFKKRGRVDLLFLIVAISMLLYADSMTSLMSLFGGIGIYLFFNSKVAKRLSRSPATVVLLIAIPVLIIATSDLLVYFVALTGHEETFWGRTEFWKVLFTLVQSPLFGSGYGGFWIGDRIAYLHSMYWWDPNQAHSGYVEIYLNLGWIGVILLILIIYSTLKQLLANIDNENSRFGLSIVMVFLAFNISEGAINKLHIIWISFLCVSFVSHLPRPQTTITSHQSK